MALTRPSAVRLAIPDAPESGSSAVRSRPAGDDASEPEPAGIVLTAHPLVIARPALVGMLRVAGYRARVVARWEDLLDAVERERVDAVILDLDGVDSRSGEARRGDLSAYRLVTLLARSMTPRGIALLVQTSLDYAEVEELVHRGAHALVRADCSDEQLLAHLEGALRRRDHRADRDLAQVACDLASGPASAVAPFSGPVVSAVDAAAAAGDSLAG